MEWFARDSSSECRRCHGVSALPIGSIASFRYIYVPSILSRGTAHRRTNETDMNAQSSRSHAIFSVTLTQKKYSGTGTPPRSGRSSPLSPSGGSPSRIVRPGSMYGGSPSRVASPTFGRHLPNSFGAAMARGGAAGMLRPSSAMGLRERVNILDDEERGEWTTVISKFHFVDLAGSERVSNFNIAPLSSGIFLTQHRAYTVKTDGRSWRARQGRYFHQQRSSCTRECHLSSG